jgi:hypothetical protein
LELPELPEELELVFGVEPEELELPEPLNTSLNRLPRSLLVDEGR